MNFDKIEFFSPIIYSFWFNQDGFFNSWKFAYKREFPVLFFETVYSSKN